MGSGWSMGGAVGGWLNESTFSGARLTDDLLPDMGGRLYGTGAGFNTWQNRADRPTGSSGFSMGSVLAGAMFGKIPGASVSYLVSPSRGWEVQEYDIKPVAGSPPTPYIKELPVAAAQAKAQQAAQVRMVQLTAAPPNRVACNY